MTRDDADARRADAQRIIDALGELFDDVPPSERAAAEQELRDGGVDPRRVAQRFERLAARGLDRASDRSDHAPAPHPSTRQPRRVVAGESSRLASATTGQGSRPRSGRAIGRSAAALLVGVAIGWLLAGDNRAPGPAMVRDGVTMLGDRQPLASGRGAESDSRAAPGAAAGPRAGLLGRREAAPHASEDSGAPPASRQEAPPADAVAAAGGEAQPPEGAHEDSGTLAQAGAGATDEPSEGPDAGSDSWVLDQANWKKAKNWLPASVLERVKSGDYRYTVQPVADQFFANHYPATFWEESAANATRYDVDRDTCGLRDAATGGTPSFYFGLPFPELHPQEPAAACKIMWNTEAVRSMRGGEEATLSLDLLEKGSPANVRRIEVQWSAMAFLGRQSGPVDNPDTLRSSSLLRAIGPPDLVGTSTMTRRPNDALKRDDSWAYVPSLRRVRRVSPANRSDGILGAEISHEELDCFDGKLEDFEWRIVGEQTVLAPMTNLSPIVQTGPSAARTTVAVPAPKARFESGDGAGAPWLIVQDLTMVPRPAWVVEAIPRDKYTLYGRLVLYIDAELYRVYWLVAYSWRGDLLKDTMCAQHWSRSVNGELAIATASTLAGVTSAGPRATLARYTSQTLDQGPPNGWPYTVQSMISYAHGSR